MEVALDVGGRNPLSGMNGKVLKFIHSVGTPTFTDIWIQFIDEVNEKEITEILGFLVAAEKIASYNDGRMVKYKLKEKGKDK
jgi:hypothetical protein